MSYTLRISNQVTCSKKCYFSYQKAIAPLDQDRIIMLIEYLSVPDADGIDQLAEHSFFDKRRFRYLDNYGAMRVEQL